MPLDWSAEKRVAIVARAQDIVDTDMERFDRYTMRQAEWRAV
jgi:hypothetical protein